MTVTSDPAARHVEARPHQSAGWLGASGSIAHGRFAPGTVLGGRYRIIGLIGRGGMGDVFRADDLRLGQPIALKFLPQDIARAPQRLAQLHNEVRTARQVSHPNVCRVYDIAEVDGELCLTMEYVDGENLAASLRRVGRFPEDRAIEIAREICAGLAAAHDRGVIHRDLKPANIMLDAAGHVRLMDFGLAVAGGFDEVSAGTPAYMAPEQLEGRSASIKSDIYALGLVLYELFTGRPAFAAATVADLVLQHASGELTPPTRLVQSLDPAIERVILKCLEQHPGRRPASVIGVAAGLPGVDPLGAAVIAGQTPSPAMVAAAAGEGATLTRAQGALSIATLIGLLWMTAWLHDRATESGRAAMRKAPSVLAEYARQARAAAGYTDAPPYEAGGFLYNDSVIRWYAANGAPAERWRLLDEGRLPAQVFWYRGSHSRLDPANPLVNPERNDPPRHLRVADSVIDVATDGRLIALFVVPPRLPTAGKAMVEADWKPLFTAADLDSSAFTPTTPEWQPTSFADQRFAWTGNMPDVPGVTLRIEASAANGRPVSFEVVGPWRRNAPPSQFAWIAPYLSLASALLQVTMLVIVLVLAGTNVRAGRVDRRSAWVIAAAALVSYMVSWAVGHHSSNASEELERFGANSGAGLFNAIVFGVAFLGVEPYVRRYFPRALVGAMRLLRHPSWDPVVGRDVLVGLTWGSCIAVVVLLYPVVPAVANLPPPAPWRSNLLYAASPAATIAFLVSISTPLLNALGVMVLVALLRRYVSAMWIVVVCSALVLTTIDNPAIGNTHGHQPQLLAVGFVAALLTVIVFVRHGLLAGFFATYARYALAAAFTLDSGRAYFHSSIAVGAVLLTLGVIGWRMARADGIAPSPAKHPHGACT